MNFIDIKKPVSHTTAKLELISDALEAFRTNQPLYGEDDLITDQIGLRILFRLRGAKSPVPDLNNFRDSVMQKLSHNMGLKLVALVNAESRFDGFCTAVKTLDDPSSRVPQLNFKINEVDRNECLQRFPVHLGFYDGIRTQDMEPRETVIVEAAKENSRAYIQSLERLPRMVGFGSERDRHLRSISNLFIEVADAGADILLLQVAVHALHARLTPSVAGSEKRAQFVVKTMTAASGAQRYVDEAITMNDELSSIRRDWQWPAPLVFGLA